MTYNNRLTYRDMADRPSDAVFEFGSFRADGLKRQLSHNGSAIPLAAKAFDTLIFLIHNAGLTVSRGALLDAVWADTAVEENNLTQQISTLRKVLGEQPGDHKFIVTVPGRGYSFVAQVNSVDPDYDRQIAAKQELASRARLDLSSLFVRGQMFGYVLAVWFILIVSLPVLLVQFRSGEIHTQSLAVLTLRSSASEEFISTGISDTLRARLGSVEDVMVRPASNGRFDQDVIAAGRELAVDSVLTGSVQRADERIRVTIEMVDVSGGRVVWGRTFDDTSSNIFELQDAIAREVASALKVRSNSNPDKLRNPFSAAAL